MDCTRLSVGSDQQLTTSAVIAYLGEDERVKAVMADIVNKTTFEPADQQDVTYTVFQILNKIGSAKLPSSQLGVNLIENAQKLAHGEKPIKQPKISLTHQNMEYSDEKGLFRMSLYGTE